MKIAIIPQRTFSIMRGETHLFAEKKKKEKLSLIIRGERKCEK